MVFDPIRAHGFKKDMPPITPTALPQPGAGMMLTPGQVQPMVLMPGTVLGQPTQPSQPYVATSAQPAGKQMVLIQQQPPAY
mmetsp:Transcript_37508/g.107357  ORF Transcript_37508/g.107357 Transcript_37508/m.107357 type:complete len:81 (-) Transcript_37508:168-410(-)